MKKSDPLSEKLFYIVILFVCVFVIIITLYPMLYTFSNSISNPYEVARKSVWLYPKGFSLTAYKYTLQNPNIFNYYFNSVFYAVVSVIFNLTLTMLLAYPLSRSNFVFRKSVSVFMIISMFFSGSMIPLFIIVKELGMYNSRWSMIIPAAMSVYNVIITRAFIKSNVHESLIESASIDGANDFYILWKIVTPLCKPILAVISLFVAVGRWNSYLDALLYLPRQDLQPIQMYLRRIMLTDSTEAVAGTFGSDMYLIGTQMKYSVVIVTMLPIMMVYPFLQKYFVKGISMGAVKG